MSQRFFLDTNVLVYSFDQSAPRKRNTAQSLLDQALAGHGVISYQVCQEFLNVALRKFSPPLSFIEAELYLRRVLMPICEVFPDLSLYSKAVSISAESGWPFYDCLIVASAIASGCSVLFSEDLQNDRTIRGVEIRNPFVSAGERRSSGPPGTHRPRGRR